MRELRAMIQAALPLACTPTHTCAVVSAVRHRMTRHPRAQRVVPTRDVHRVRATQHRVGHVVRRGVLRDVRQRANHRGARHAVGRPARPQREGVLVDHQLT